MLYSWVRRNVIPVISLPRFLPLRRHGRRFLARQQRIRHFLDPGDGLAVGDQVDDLAERCRVGWPCCGCPRWIGYAGVGGRADVGVFEHFGGVL